MGFIHGFLASMMVGGTVLLISRANKKRKIRKIISKAEQGDVESQCELALQYFSGEHIKKDVDKGFYWLYKAVYQEDVYAQNFLGFAFLGANLLVKMVILPYIGMKKH